jgi:hypothetical protein
MSATLVAANSRRRRESAGADRPSTNCRGKVAISSAFHAKAGIDRRYQWCHFVNLTHGLTDFLVSDRLAL